MVQTYREALRCEVLRAEIFAGKRTPLVFGDPEPWLALLMQALKLTGAGNDEAARLAGAGLRGGPGASAEHRRPALRVDRRRRRPSGAGARGDRQRPLLLDPVRPHPRDSTRGPADLRDVVWTPAQFSWANEGKAVGLIPTRYAGASHEDDAIKLARKTEWDVRARSTSDSASACWPPIETNIRCSNPGHRAGEPGAGRGAEPWLSCPEERLQPSLLDRLTDDDPERQKEVRTSGCSRCAAARRRHARPLLAAQHGQPRRDGGSRRLPRGRPRSSTTACPI